VFEKKKRGGKKKRGNEDALGGPSGKKTSFRKVEGLKCKRKKESPPKGGIN